MSVPTMKFVLVNDMASPKASICAWCALPLDRRYLHDLSTSKCYCGVECYPRWMLVSGTFGSTAPASPFELSMTWAQLTFGVASALFDSAWGYSRD
jgi:hypothetical protein